MIQILLHSTACLKIVISTCGKRAIWWHIFFSFQCNVVLFIQDCYVACHFAQYGVKLYKLPIWLGAPYFVVQHVLSTHHVNMNGAVVTFRFIAFMQLVARICSGTWKGLWLSVQGTWVAPPRSRVRFPVGTNFWTGLKKPLPLHTPKHRLRPCQLQLQCVVPARHSHRTVWPLCKGGRGVRGFPRPAWEGLLLNIML
jgi:hypothetical protein